ncbi:MAG: hypothetical protein JW856_02345 [Dehalococcoidales bacterium]|nr:hypothetical protein [Dehalococcoidales bacterium]
MKRVEEILIHCIDDIKAGRATLAECLERYPDVRAELEPLLRVALAIKEKPDVKPSDAFKIRARARLIEHIYASQSQKKTIVPSSQPGIRYSWFTGWTRAVAITVAVVLVVAAAGTGTAYASRPSLPGDTLYSVKLGTEQLQRIFTFDTAAEVELELKFADIRLNEIDELASMPADQAATINSGGSTVLAMSVIGFMSNKSEETYITQAERIEQAAAGYEKNLNMAITKSEQVSNNTELLEKVALAILTHLDRLDEIEDKTFGEMVQIIARSKAVALNGHMNAVNNLAFVNLVRANEINQQAIQNRLERAEAEAAKGKNTEAQNALQEMEKLRQFGDEIPNSNMDKGQDSESTNGDNGTTPGMQHETPDSDNGQSSQGTTDDTNPSDQGQGTQNQTQQDGQENPTIKPPTSPTETTPNGNDGNTQPQGDNSSGSGGSSQ